MSRPHPVRLNSPLHPHPLDAGRCRVEAEVPTQVAEGAYHFRVISSRTVSRDGRRRTGLAAATWRSALRLASGPVNRASSRPSLSITAQPLWIGTRDIDVAGTASSFVVCGGVKRPRP